MAIANTTDIIANWPVEDGCTLSEAYQRMPSFAYTKRPDSVLAAAARYGLMPELHVALQTVKNSCEKELRPSLDSGELVLVPHGADEPISRVLIRYLQLDPDAGIVRDLHTGAIHRAVMVYKAGTWKPKPDPTPLAVTIKGPVILAPEHRSEDAEIIKVADEEFPGGWRSVKPKTLVVNRVLNQMNWDSSKRDRVLRALGWRKG
jgi:hypothetical protein